MAVTFTVETFHALYPDLKPVWEQEHAPETSPHPGLIATLDADTFRIWQDLNLLHCLTARDDGTLVAYYLSLEMQFPVALGYSTQTSVLYYVRPAWRHQGIGRQLLAEWERLMRRKGRQLLFTSSKLALGVGHHDFMEQLGFVPNEIVYSKHLED